MDEVQVTALEKLKNCSLNNYAHIVALVRIYEWNSHFINEYSFKDI